MTVIFTDTDPLIDTVWGAGIGINFLQKPISPGETVEIELGSSGFSIYTGGPATTAALAFGFFGGDYIYGEQPAGGGTVSFRCTPAKDLYTVSPIVGVEPGYVFNDVKAGTAVPLRFKVTNYWGEPVTNLREAPDSFGYLFYRQRCPIGVGIGDVMTPPPPDSILGTLINFQNGTYQLNWKTQKAWAGTCWGFQIGVPYSGGSFSLFYMR